MIQKGEEHRSSERRDVIQDALSNLSSTPIIFDNLEPRLLSKRFFNHENQIV